MKIDFDVAVEIEIVFHVFTDGKDDWIDDFVEALCLYNKYMGDEVPARLYIQVYTDRENDFMVHEDCLLSFGDFPS